MNFLNYAKCVIRNENKIRLRVVIRVVNVPTLSAIIMKMFCTFHERPGSIIKQFAPNA